MDAIYPLGSKLCNTSWVVPLLMASVLPENLVTESVGIRSKQAIKSAQQTTMIYIYVKYGKIVLIFR